MIAPSILLDRAMKGIYVHYLRNSYAPTPSSLPSIQFMIGCVKELYMLDVTAAYQHSFVYIRELAMQLRLTLQTGTHHSNSKNSKSNGHVKGSGKKSNDYSNGKALFGWNFVNAVRVWAQLIGSNDNTGGQQELSSLIYPLVQITLGAIR